MYINENEKLELAIPKTVISAEPRQVLTGGGYYIPAKGEMAGRFVTIEDLPERFELEYDIETETFSTLPMKWTILELVEYEE